jgi:hypothetical protein
MVKFECVLGVKDIADLLESADGHQRSGQHILFEACDIFTKIAIKVEGPTYLGMKTRARQCC